MSLVMIFGLSYIIFCMFLVSFRCCSGFSDKKSSLSMIIFHTIWIIIFILDYYIFHTTIFNIVMMSIFINLLFSLLYCISLYRFYSNTPELPL